MIRASLATFCASVAVAFDGDQSPVGIDIDSSTHELGIVAWQPFYQLYINSLFSSVANAPENFNQDVHLCWW